MFYKKQICLTLCLFPVIMNSFILLTLCGVALGQLFPLFPWGSAGDRIHGYHFTYHDNNQILVIRNSESCWIVEISDELRNDMHHRATREKIEDELYQQILDHDGETPGNHEEIREKYHDRLDSFLCIRHKTYHLQYHEPTKE